MEGNENISSTEKEAYSTFIDALQDATDENGFIETESISEESLSDIVNTNTDVSSKAEILLQYKNDEFTRHDIPTNNNLRKSRVISNNFTQNITLYPNPTSNTLYIDYKLEKGINAVMEVSDIVGKPVYLITLNSEKVTEEINLSNLTSGMYHVRIKSGVKILYADKVIVIR